MVAFRIPVATYRLQLNQQFRFQDVHAILDHLSQLGITDIYVSPLFKARKGSNHGYDITDHQQLNPELGSQKDLQALRKDLRRHEMGLLLDIVPNHMALSPDNRWWMDVLENGRASPFADYFDIEWQAHTGITPGKVMLPILGAPIKEIIEKHELILVSHKGGLCFKYFDTLLPLDAGAYGLVLQSIVNDLMTRDVGHQCIERAQRLSQSISHLPQHGGSDLDVLKPSYSKRQRAKREFTRLINSDPTLEGALNRQVRQINNDFHRIFDLLELQAYQLSYWRTGIENINYRRFFDINELIGVCVEKREVFEKTHRLIKNLVQDGIVTGLRVDHIDGLQRPFKYLQLLQSSLVDGQPAEHHEFYVVVEKILIEDEQLPLEWPSAGTTGYDFLNRVNALFVDWAGFQILENNYKRFTSSDSDFTDIVYSKKKQIMIELFVSEIKTLAHKLRDLATHTDNICKSKDQDFLNSLIEVTACLPVYRTYTESFGVSARDRRYIEEAVAEAQQRVTETEREALGFLRHILLLDLKSNDSEVKKNEWLSWLIRWQQFTGAIMAKGLEDTALYSYNPLISLNDVGSKPISVDSPVEFFHHFNLIRLSDWPHTMNATSTHDTKRSEDVRARLNILSEIPATWNESLIKWSILNDPKKESVDGNVVPDLAMETLIYQTLIGAWPLMENEVLSFWERFKDYCLKAARESKTYTSWISPNNLYESALIRFIEEILDDSEQCEFLKDFRELQRYVAYYGAINSLSQLLLKITSPGIPDFYQGTETWNFSLVDPDNRRPVRYHRNMQMLSELKRRETNEVNTLVRELLSTWEDGRVKLFIIYKALNTRQAYQDLFSDGDYIPHQAYGERTDHVCAFSRRRADCWALVATPRLVTKVVSVDQLPVGQDVWGDDYLMLPDNAPRDWKNIFTEEHIQLTSKDICLPVSLAFNVFPVALLMSQPK